MGEFFKGWRRKAGCVTLVMACVFMAIWLRTFAATDTIIVGQVGISSVDGVLAVVTNDEIPTPRWESADAIRLDSDRVRFHWQLRLFGFRRGVDGDDQAWTIPYWSIVIPLTLLSAYLLLTKPRQSTASVTQPDRPAAV